MHPQEEERVNYTVDSMRQDIQKKLRKPSILRQHPLLEKAAAMGTYKCPNAHQGVYNVPTIEGQDYVDFGNNIVYQWCTICRKYVRRERHTVADFPKT